MTGLDGRKEVTPDDMGVADEVFLRSWVKSGKILESEYELEMQRRRNLTNEGKVLPFRLAKR